MSDEELNARLRKADEYEPLGHDGWEAAYRIEALSAKLATCEKYRDAYAEMDRIGTQAVRDLEAKLAKAVEALEQCEIMLRLRGHDEVAAIARATLAEIKEESHEALPDLR